MALPGSAAKDPLAISRLARLCSWLSMSVYSAAETTAYTATAINTTTMATMDMASNITRHRSDSDDVGSSGARSAARAASVVTSGRCLTQHIAHTPHGMDQPRLSFRFRLSS